MRGKAGLFIVLAFLMLISFSALILSDDQDSDAASYDYDGNNVAVIWDSSFAKSHSGYNNLNLPPGSGKCILTITVPKYSTPNTIGHGFYDASNEDSLIRDVQYTENTTTSPGSGTTVIKVTIEDVADLPEVSVLKINNSSSLIKADFVKLRIHVGEIIITATNSGNQVAVLDVSKGSSYSWNVKKYSFNEDLRIADYEAGRKNVSIIYDGAVFRNVYLFSVNDKSSLSGNIDVTFSMYGGSITSLSFFHIPKSVQDSLPALYDSAPMALHSASVAIRGGTVGSINPTSDMVYILDYTLELSGQSSVNRVYISGEKGRYGSISALVDGAHIGYMTNLASKIGEISYDIRTGTIDYFCIGANSDHYHSSQLSQVPTSYVSNDVNVRISELAQVKNCIVGAGVLVIPRILSDGSLTEGPVIHMVRIDAPSTEVYNELTFFSDNRKSAYVLSNYKIGDTVTALPIMKSLNIDGRMYQTYSPEGVWESLTDCTIGASCTLYIDTDFIVMDTYSLYVAKGATLVNSNYLIINGRLVNEGAIINNSVLQYGPKGEVEGEISGIGSLSDTAINRGSSDSINIRSTRSSVTVDIKKDRPDDLLAITSISVLFTDEKGQGPFVGDVSVLISAPDEPISDDKFTISLDNRSYSNKFDNAFTFVVKGIGLEVLDKCQCKITLPVDHDYCTSVYYYDHGTNAYVLLASAEWTPEITFFAEPNTGYYLQRYSGDRPDIDDGDSGSSGRISFFDYVLISVNIAILCGTVYALITMKRD